MWGDTKHELHLWAANRALTQNGKVAYAISLDLSQEAIAAARASGISFGGHFAKALTRSLARRLGRKPQFWIAVDATPQGRLHLHGGISIDPQEASRVHEALVETGGKWESPRGKDYQAHEKPQYSPDGWVRYAIRMRSKVRHLVKGSPYTIANGLRREARDLYERLRRELLAGRRRPSPEKRTVIRPFVAERIRENPMWGMF